MMNALRLTQGFALADFTAFTGLDWNVAAAQMGQLRERGLVIFEEGHVYRPSALGLRFLNDVVGCFLPPRVQRTLQPALSTAWSRYAQPGEAVTANEQIT
jgi:hypothetical protein